MASVSATDLNTTDVVSVDNMAVENDDVSSVVENNEVVSVDENTDNVSSAENVDELSITDDSEVLGVTRYVNPGDNLGSVIGSASSGDTIILNGGSYYICDFAIGKSLTFIGVNNPILTTNERGDKCMLFIKADVTFKNLILQGTRAQWGAACYVCSNCLFTVDNCTFRNDIASKGGGGILCDNGGRCKVLNSYFASNVYSSKTGGAIRIETSAEIINCTFEGSYAGECGGAIYAYKSSMLKVINSTFIKCSSQTGGAIRIESSNQAIIDSCNFENCFATDCGGAIDAYGLPNIKILNSNFTNCYCVNYDGGAISFDSCSNIDISNSYFDTCHSRIGGAVRIVKSSSINVGDSTFIGNYAKIGGAIVIGGSSDSYSKNSIINNCKFLNNSASESGGAVAHREANNLKIYDSYFEGNSAGHSGAVNQWYREGIIFNSTFKNNSASSDSGAVHGVILDSCKLIGNTAGGNGGAASNSVSSNCIFENNHANGNGGALNVVGDSITLDKCTFLNCSSSKDGAAVYLSSGKNLKLTNCAVESCISDNGKSIGFASGTSILDVLDCVFDVIPQGIPYHQSSILSADDLSIVKGDSAIINVVLSNKLSPLSKREVVFSVNGNKISKTTDSSGFVSFDATNYLSVSNNEISISYAGDEINNAVSKIVNVKVNLYMGSLSIIQSGKYYRDKSFSIKYKDSKNKVREDIPIKIIIYANGEVFKTDERYTDSNNMVTYSMSTENFVPGNYSVYAYVDIDNVDITPIKMDNVIISKISGVIELSKSKSNKTLYVTLVNKTTGDVFSGINVKLQFNRNGYEGSVTTGSDGSKSFSMSDFKPDTYSVHASVDSSGFKEFNDVDLENIVITTAGKEDSILEFGNNIVFDYLKSGYTTVTKIEGCTIGECVIEGHPDVRVGVNGNKITVYGDNLFGAGTYNLKVTTVPDVDHNAVTKTVKVTVNKIDSSLNLNSVTCNFGDSVTITPSNMVGCGISYVNVSVVGQKPKIDVINSVITVSGLPAGEHTLKVVTTPDKNYNSVTKTAKITVRKVKSAIGFNPPVSFVYGSVGQIPLTLEGCSIVRESCAVDGYSKAIIDVNKNVVKVSNLSVGSYTLRISSIPDSNHTEDTKEIVFSVTPTASNVDLSPKSITFDYGTTGTANLILDGCTVLSDDVVVEGYSTAITRVADGVLYVSNLTANTYTLQIKTTPDGNHKSVTKKFSVTVNKPLSTVEFIGSADFDYLGEGKTTLKLTGCTVSLDDIEVVGYGDAGLTIGKGNIITISELDSGKYTLKVKTNPDSNHRANTATLTFTVNKIDSKISFTKDAISFKYAESGSTPIVLENCKVANMSIVGHDDVKPVLDDDEITVSGLPVGSYVMKVTTDPDDNYNSVDAYINVTVVKNTATITVKKSQTVAYKKSTNWAITLKDSSGKPVSGVKVNLKIYKGNKLYKNVNNLKVTDANGVTNYNAKGLPVGTYKFVVSVSHAGYNVKSVSTPVKVIKQTPVKIILNTKSDKKGAVISIIVKDKAGKKYLNNIKLTLSIKNGKTYNTVTLITGNYKSGKGVSAYSTNMLTVGSHNVKVETADIKYSGSASKNVKVLASAKKYRNWWEKISKGKKTSYGT